MEKQLINNNELNKEQKNLLDLKLKILKDNKTNFTKIINEISKDENNLKLNYLNLVNILNNLKNNIDETKKIINNSNNFNLYFQNFHKVYTKIIKNTEELKKLISKLNGEKSKTILFENDCDIMDFDEEEETVKRNTDGIKIDIEKVSKLLKKIKDDNDNYFKNLEANFNNYNKNKKSVLVMDELNHEEKNEEKIIPTNNSKPNNKMKLIIIISILIIILSGITVFFLLR